MSERARFVGGASRGFTPVAEVLPPDRLDLPKSRSFREALPVLAEIFDAQAMRERLEAVLMADGFSIESCQPVKAIFLRDRTCSLQYNLQIRPENGGAVFSGLINARVFPDRGDAHKYYEEALAPLSSRSAGRVEFTPFVQPVATLPDLGMTLAVFPADGEIPTLLEATDPARMQPILEPALRALYPGTEVVESFFLDPAHYGRFNRCVLRYHVKIHPKGGGPSQEVLVFGKLDAGGLGRRILPVIQQVSLYIGTARNPFPFRVPRTFGYWPELKLLLLEGIPGDAHNKRLLKDRMEGRDSTRPGELTLEESLEACARIADALHRSGISLGPIKTLEDELRSLTQDIDWVKSMDPALGGWLEAVLRGVAARAERQQPMALRFCHGDYRYTQLIFSGKKSGLVDFDTVCQAEPALDLGQFLAYQRMRIKREQPKDRPFPAGAAEALCEYFLQVYIEAAKEWVGDEHALRERVRVYEMTSLLRLAVHSWQKFKGTRLLAVLQVIEERLK